MSPSGLGLRPLNSQELPSIKAEHGQLLRKPVSVGRLERALDVGRELVELFAQFLLVLQWLRANELILVVREGRLGSEQQAEDGARHCPVVGVAGVEQRVEQGRHEAVPDVRRGCHVFADQLHGGLLAVDVEEHIRRDVVDRAGALRTDGQLWGCQVVVIVVIIAVKIS